MASSGARHLAGALSTTAATDGSLPHYEWQRAGVTVSSISGDVTVPMGTSTTTTQAVPMTPNSYIPVLLPDILSYVVHIGPGKWEPVNGNRQIVHVPKLTSAEKC